MKNQPSNSTPIYFQDATALAQLIRNREISPVEAMKAHLDRIETLNPTVNAIVTVAEDALEAAIMRGDELGPLHDVPFMVKDSIDTAKVLTQRGSPILRAARPMLMLQALHA